MLGARHGTRVSLVAITDKNAKVGGLVCMKVHATNPIARAILAKLGTLNRSYDSVLKPLIQQQASAAAGRPVVLLNGNFVSQKKGVVSYHGSNPLLGKYVEGGRKGWNDKTGEFHLWVVAK